MNTQVEFRPAKFPPYEAEEEQINPGLWGKRLAEYLVEKLSSKNGIFQGCVVRLHMPSQGTLTQPFSGLAGLRRG